MGLIWLFCNSVLRFLFAFVLSCLHTDRKVCIYVLTICVHCFVQTTHSRAVGVETLRCA